MKSLFTLSILTAISLPFSLHAEPKKYPYLEEPNDPELSSEPPAGWEIKFMDNTKIQSAKTLRNGTKVKVSLEPYEIIPNLKQGAQLIPEPGFNAQLGLQQKKTYLAVTAQTLEQLTQMKSEIDTLIKSLETALNPTAKETQTTPATPPSSPSSSSSSSSKNTTSPNTQNTPNTPNAPNSKPNP